MNKEFIAAINQVCHERQLPKEVVLEAIHAALVSAYRRRFGPVPGITARLDLETCTAHIYSERTVVEHVSDAAREIAWEEARRIKPDANVGEVVLVDITPRDFGRIAAQTARQVILQRIREAERDSLYHAYADREGEIVNGTVQSIDFQQVILSLGKVEAILPRSEQIPTERFSVGQRLRAYVSEVQKTPRGPLILVSRTHRNMLRRLLELEVPEIYNGTVEVKAVAREAGYRSKVAVAALQDGVDPVGSCVGMRGVRIQSIVNELNGEKIDVVAWSSDPATFIANSLSPAKVLNVMLEDDNDDKTAVVVVPDRQLSLAIGKEGQNARLAAKLTNWRIDIKSISEAASEALAKIAEYKDVQAAVAREQNLITMAREILEEKEGTALSDGEMQVLSQVVRIVYEAEKSLEKEHAALRLREAVIRALEEEEPSETSPRLEHPEDLLARAEAILAAKSAEAGEEQPQEAEASVSEGAEASEAALPEAVPFPLWEEEAAVVMGETAETSPQMETAPQEISLEKEQGNLQAAEEFYVWEDEEEEGEELPGQARKKKQRGKRHELIYDEKLGAYVPRRQRKPGRQRGGWEDYL